MGKQTDQATSVRPGTASVRGAWAGRLCAAGLALGLLQGCAQFGDPGSQAPRLASAACSSPAPGLFITGAEWHPGASRPLGIMDRLTSHAKLDGDLAIAAAEVAFTSCFELTGRNDPGRQSYAIREIETAYRDGSWLFLRFHPDDQGQRRFQGFHVHGTPGGSGDQVAKAALAELRRQLPSPSVRGYAAAATPVDVAIVDKGDPELWLAVVSRDEVAGKTGQGAAGGALGGVGAGLQSGLILFPPAAAVLVVGGAVIGGTVGAVGAEVEAQRNARLTPLNDAILNRAARELAISSRLAEGIEQRLQIEHDWRIARAGGQAGTAGPTYQNWALQGIAGVIEIGPLRVELRASRNDLDKNQEDAGHTLSVAQSVHLYSTLTGARVTSIDLTLGSGRHSLAEWRAEDGRLFRIALDEAVRDMPEAAAGKLQGVLDQLIRFE